MEHFDWGWTPQPDTYEDWTPPYILVNPPTNDEYVLLRTDRDTYYHDESQWVKDPEDATVFTSITELVNVAAWERGLATHAVKFKVLRMVDVTKKLPGEEV